MASIFEARAKFFFNTPEMMARLGKWRHKTLSRTGAYGLGVFRKLLGRHQLKKKDQLVTFTTSRLIKGQSRTVQLTCRVPGDGGAVIDERTGRKVSIADAMQARARTSNQHRGKGEGKPPRMGPTRKLRNISAFSFDPATEGVVIGIIPFTKQPAMAGTVSVPELLDVGGTEIIDALGGSVAAHYGERPFTIPAFGPTWNQFMRSIEKHPAHR